MPWVKWKTLSGNPVGSGKLFSKIIRPLDILLQIAHTPNLLWIIDTIVIFILKVDGGFAMMLLFYTIVNCLLIVIIGSEFVFYLKHLQYLETRSGSLFSAYLPCPFGCFAKRTFLNWDITAIGGAIFPQIDSLVSGTWRIIPVSKWLVTSIYTPFRYI